METTFVKGMPTGLFVGAILAAEGAKATRPTPVTLTVGTEADPEDTSISLTAVADTVVPKGAVLDFDGVVVTVATTTTVTSASTAVPISAAPALIEASKTASWTGLFRVTGTSASTKAVTETTNQLRSVTYDSNEKLEWDEMQVTGKGWTLSREGRYKPTDAAFLVVEEAAHSNREIWVERLLPDEDGNAARYERGRAKITGLSVASPAEGMVDASWTFTGQGKLETGPVS